jgi:L-fucose mutarotase/ribose pyranase (RbsD/FucU family)
MLKPKLAPPLLTQALAAAGHGGKVLITDSQSRC